MGLKARFVRVNKKVHFIESANEKEWANLIRAKCYSSQVGPVELAWNWGPPALLTKQDDHYRAILPNQYQPETDDKRPLSRMVFVRGGTPHLKNRPFSYFQHLQRSNLDGKTKYLRIYFSQQELSYAIHHITTMFYVERDWEIETSLSTAILHACLEGRRQLSILTYVKSLNQQIMLGPLNEPQIGHMTQTDIIHTNHDPCEYVDG